jgi:acyl dehydratase
MMKDYAEGNHPMPLLKDVCQGHIDQKTSVTLDSNPTLIDDACAKQTAFGTSLSHKLVTIS